MQCRVEGCDRTDIKGWELCPAHYEKQRKWGDPLFDGEAAYGKRLRDQYLASIAGGSRTCTVCKETKPLDDYYYNRQKDWYYSWCKQCHKDKGDARRLHHQIENPKRMGRRPVDHGTCAYEPCDNKATTRVDGQGPIYCHGHYQQRREGKELKPLRDTQRSLINDRFRRCTACQQVKPQELFNWRTGRRSRQSECKKCQYKRVVFNKYVREGRDDDAQDVFDSMPEKLQEKLGSRLEAA